MTDIFDIKENISYEFVSFFLFFLSFIFLTALALFLFWFLQKKNQNRESEQIIIQQEKENILQEKYQYLLKNSTVLSAEVFRKKVYEVIVLYFWASKQETDFIAKSLEEQNQVFANRKLSQKEKKIQEIKTTMYHELFQKKEINQDNESRQKVLDLLDKIIWW